MYSGHYVAGIKVKSKSLYSCNGLSCQLLRILVNCLGVMIQNLTEYLLVSFKERVAYILCVVPVDSSLIFCFQVTSI